MEIQKKKGFTLVELLVVISIISLLSSVVLSALSSARAKSRDAQRIANAHSIINALAIYFNQYGTYDITTLAGNGTGYYFAVPNPAVGCADMTYGLAAASYRYSISQALVDRGLLTGDFVDPKYGGNSCSLMKYDTASLGTCIYTKLENTSTRGYDVTVDPGVCGGDCGMRYKVCL
ncbi:MAG: prepilin-type N-terminal cleavage/methylation domain-containing protein [bacterium]